MIFTTDKQTLDDLKLLGKPGQFSVYSIYNNTRTRGGSDILEQMFLYPMADKASIDERVQTFQYFNTSSQAFPFAVELLDNAEMYLRMTDQRTMLSQTDDSIARKFSQLISADGDYKVIISGIVAIAEIVQILVDFVSRNLEQARASPYHRNLKSMDNLLSTTFLIPLLSENNIAKLPYTRLADLDKLLRFKEQSIIKALLDHIYELDVFITVAEVALKREYVFPAVLNEDERKLKLKGIYHPMVENAKGNNIDLSTDANVVFLTGANMAGKSTFMKSLGIALYLAHMGFPVAARQMEFSVMDGIYTTINLPDDLSSGNSHFYAEVLRVKKIAKELGTNKNLFVIFDELFRGTNVKDAYEGTIAITEAFARKTNCMFVVSTHIIEAGEVLKLRCDNINFLYLPTLMDGNQPIYTYKLQTGITADRHGMIIINNERILEIIRSRNTPESKNKISGI